MSILQNVKKAAARLAGVAGSREGFDQPLAPQNGAEQAQQPAAQPQPAPQQEAAGPNGQQAQPQQEAAGSNGQQAGSRPAKGGWAVLPQTIAVAFGMFSAIPAPRSLVWNKANMRYALCAFPLVGAACAVCWSGWAMLAGWLALPQLLRGAGFCLAPVLVTGGIHLDGYADTSDALASWGDAAKKQAILQDSHCGAFAVIRMCCYFTAYLGFATALAVTPQSVFCMGVAFMLERCFSGVAVAAFPLAKDTGLAHTFATAADRATVRRTLLALAAVLWALMLAAAPLPAVLMAAALLGVFWHYRRVAVRQFGGITGDLAGWFLQRAELAMLAALALAPYIQTAVGRVLP